MVSTQNLLGLSDTHIDFSLCEVPLHPDLRSPLATLKRDAASQGFTLTVASGYRNFKRQCHIWNGKVTGARPLLDINEQQLDPKHLSPKALVFAILRWSALPGTSRHHWGTDFDIYEATALQEKRLELSVAETQLGGVFHDFYIWLDQYLQKQTMFIRPYRYDTGGVSPEPWHLSYLPLAKEFSAMLTRDDYVSELLLHPFALSDVVLDNIDEIWERFVV